jgi:protein ImuB
MPRVASLCLPHLPTDRLQRIERESEGRRNSSSSPHAGRGTAQSAVEGGQCLARTPLHQPAAGPPPRSGEDHPPVEGWRPGARWARAERRPAFVRETRAAMATPMVTIHRSGQRMTIAAACPVAEALGLDPGMAVTQARALVPGLDIRDAEPQADLAFLTRLALFAARRWTPRAAVSDDDGLWLDLGGVAHLFGDEAALCRRILHFCARLGFDARIAVAGTAGAAHALARYGVKELILCPSGGEAEAIAPLPLAALRLDDDVISAAHRLGIDRIADLMAMPRGPLERRFGGSLLGRLDQALGRAAEAIEPIVPEEAPSALLRFAEPIANAEAIAEAMRRLMDDLVATLESQGLAVRSLVLRCSRIDGEEQRIAIGTARATRDRAHLLSLLIPRIETIEPGFGIEAMQLVARRCEPLGARPIESGLAGPPEPDLVPLIDRLVGRLGLRRLFRLSAVESDVPERSLARIPPLEQAAGWPPHWPRPVRLLARPEPIDKVVALLPDGPPRRFTWRGDTYVVRRADGPERIYGEWWKDRAEAEAVRDYFQVEDEDGFRFWIFRRGDGVDPRTGDLAWYLHGVFG